MTWSWETVADAWPVIWSGFTWTVRATALAGVLALVLGLAWALLRRSRTRWLRWPADWAFDFVRSTPLLIQLYFLYYVLPEVGLGMPRFATGVLGLTLHYGAYMAEVYRAGIEAVPRGQWEAATTLRIPRRTAFLRIILPQALPPILPVLCNYIIGMFKDSALLMVISVPEMLMRARSYGSEHATYLEPLTMAGALYLVASVTSSLGVRAMEKRLAH